MSYATHFLFVFSPIPTVHSISPSILLFSLSQTNPFQPSFTAYFTLLYKYALHGKTSTNFSLYVCITEQTTRTMFVVPNWAANSNCTFLCLSHIGKTLIQNWIYPVGLLSVLSNLLVLISSGLILKSKVHPRSTYMYLGNLALADLLHGTIFLYILTFYPTIKEGISCVYIIGEF